MQFYALSTVLNIDNWVADTDAYCRDSNSDTVVYNNSANVVYVGGIVSLLS